MIRPSDKCPEWVRHGHTPPLWEAVLMALCILVPIALLVISWRSL